MCVCVFVLGVVHTLLEIAHSGTERAFNIVSGGARRIFYHWCVVLFDPIPQPGGSFSRNARMQFTARTQIVNGLE